MAGEIMYETRFVKIYMLKKKREGQKEVWETNLNMGNKEKNAAKCSGVQIKVIF